MLVASVCVGGVPSPKYQARLVMVPVERSENRTVNGFRPLVGLSVKAACGSEAPVPVRTLVLLPPLLVKVSALVKLAALVGVKLTTRLVETKPARLNEATETIAKGPSLTETAPLVMGAPPRLVTTKLAWAVSPASTSRIPKSKLAGDT